LTKKFGSLHTVKVKSSYPRVKWLAEGVRALHVFDILLLCNPEIGRQREHYESKSGVKLI
jgi:hypothetical protein